MATAKKDKNDLPNAILSVNNVSETNSSSSGSSFKSRLSNIFNKFKSYSVKFGVASVLWSIGYMNWSALWIVIGVFVSMYVTEKSRKDAAANMILKDTMEDSKTLVDSISEVYRISGKELPSWIYLSNVEQADWLNKIIEKLWPYIGRYADKLLTDKVQKSIQESHTLLSSFAFTAVNLGRKAPRVAGIVVHGEPHEERDEIIIDMELVYDGDCDIDLSVGVVSAGIRDIKLRGLLRIELKPIIDTMPLVGAVSFGFVKDPVLDFDLTELGNLLDFPGVSDAVRGAIIDSIGSMMVLPEKYIMKLSPDVDISLLRFPLPKGVLRIHIIEAENLSGKDIGFFSKGKSDPYVTIKELRVRVGHRVRHRTKTINDTHNPKWNEVFEALVRDYEHGKIEFDVYDDDGAMAHDYLGRIEINIKSVYERGVIQEKINLKEADSGKVHLRLEWFDMSSNLHDIKDAMKGDSSCAVLAMYINKATNLIDTDDNATLPSPYIKIQLPGMEAFKTQVIQNSNEPTWEENFHVFLTVPHETEVKFRFKDKKRKKRFFRSRDRSSRSRDRNTKGKDAENKINDHDSGSHLGIFKLSVKDLLAADDMMIEKPFPLQKSNDGAALHARFTLRLMKAKPQSTTSSSHDKSFTVSDRKLNGNINSSNNVNPKMRMSSLESDGTDVSREVGFGSRSNDNLNETYRLSISTTQSDPDRPELNRTNERGNSPSATVPSKHGRIQLTLLHSNSLLVVHVMSAENLIICDEDEQTSDPYVKVYINDLKMKSRVVKNNLNPVFEERMEFDLPHTEVSQSELKVKIKNHTGMFSSEKRLMGVVSIDLSKIDLRRSDTKWYNLKSPDE